MRNEQLFSEIGINPLLAVELMDRLSLSIDDLSFPQNIGKLQDIVEYLKKYDSDGQKFLIRKITHGKENRLKVMHEYITLLKEDEFCEQDIKRTEISKLTADLEYDENKKIEANNVLERLNNRRTFLKEEINLYHK